MPSNNVRINESPKLDWYVGDSKIDAVIAVLDALGSRSQGEGKPSTPQPPGMPHAEVAKGDVA